VLLLKLWRNITVKIIALILFAIFLITTALHADSATTTSASTKKEPTATAAKSSTTDSESEKKEKVKGRVKKIDAAKHTIKVKIGEDSKVYTFSSTTKFVKGEKPVEFSAVKKGDRVVITKDSKNFAHKVKIETDSTNSE
jgi:maltose-binding protein MalE